MEPWGITLETEVQRKHQELLIMTSATTGFPESFDCPYRAFDHACKVLVRTSSRVNTAGNIAQAILEFEASTKRVLACKCALIGSDLSMTHRSGFRAALHPP
jgi:hypothetical protein